MGIFGNIMKKLGFGNDTQEEQTEALGALDTSVAETPAADMPNTQNKPAESAVPETTSTTVTVVDVVAKLETLSEQNPGLNWKTSIVDLLKLLGMDSSYAHRKELASEMGIDGYEGTAEQNIALHKAVLQKIAQNGGNIPKELFQ